MVRKSHRMPILCGSDPPGRFPRADELLEEAAPDLLAFTAFPKEHWRQIRSNNLRSASTRSSDGEATWSASFPNREAVIALLGTVLAEKNDEWAAARRYMSAELLAKVYAGSDTEGVPAITEAA